MTKQSRKFTTYQSITIVIPAGTPIGQVISNSTEIKRTFSPGYVTGILVQDLDNGGNLRYEAGLEVDTGFSLVDFMNGDVMNPDRSVPPDEKFLSLTPNSALFNYAPKIRTLTTSGSSTTLGFVLRIEDLTEQEAANRRAFMARQNC